MNTETQPAARRAGAPALRTRIDTGASHFVGFAMVGVSGLLVNSLVLALATEKLGIYYLISAALASVCSTLWNFSLTELWVFRDRQHLQGWLKRLAWFFAMNQAALLVRGPILYVLTSGFGVYYLLSNLISLGLMTVLRFAFADQWIWAGPRAAEANLHGYSVHGIVTILSDVSLPELEPFRTTEVIERPTLRVRVGWVPLAPSSAAPGGRSIRYDEGLLQFGFQVRIEIADQTEVWASPLLKLSPHVLYTNVVEPILRWTLVEKGYALVHGACLAFGECAYLITARTDTGKTTTLLQILSHQNRAAFIADDLTLVSPEGQVLTYPKPLTISSHTVHAVNVISLSPLERLTMPFQSRIHSRSGRRLAHRLARTKLPMATLNALVQWMVPPPKYLVQQLVPGVKLARTARLGGMFVIDQEGSETVHLAPDEALTVLMQNCEDAYGFPPYPAIASFLSQSPERDLRAVERAIVANALRGVPATLIRSRVGWWQQILHQVVADGAGELSRPPEGSRLAPEVAR